METNQQPKRLRAEEMLLNQEADIDWSGLGYELAYFRSTTLSLMQAFADQEVDARTAELEINLEDSAHIANNNASIAIQLKAELEAAKAENERLKKLLETQYKFHCESKQISIYDTMLLWKDFQQIHNL